MVFSFAEIDNRILSPCGLQDFSEYYQGRIDVPRQIGTGLDMVLRIPWLQNLA
jgi:hypothetical protein